MEPRDRDNGVERLFVSSAIVRDDQAYSHVGLIHAAFAVSPTWSEIL